MSVPSGVSNDYDEVDIKADPMEISFGTAIIYANVQDIADQLNAIFTTLQGLQLAWTGDSASVAHDFTNRWTTAAKDLFGSGQDSDPGVMGALISCLQSAVQNYSMTETAVSQMFQTFSSGLSGGSSGSSGSTTSVINHQGSDALQNPYDNTSVDENFG
jgi:hypothetical protein